MEDQREIDTAGRATEVGDGAEAGAEAEPEPEPEPVLVFRDPCMVIWDVESCPLSKDLNLDAKDILPMIRRRLSLWGYSGPIQMVAIGRSRSCARCKLADTGILISQVSSGKRLSSIPVLCAMYSWIENNPAPANILFIARDRNYLPIFKSLNQHNYNILRRQKSFPGKENHNDYCWGWSELMYGERPQSHSKRLEDNDGPSLMGEPIERRDGSDAAASSLVR